VKKLVERNPETGEISNSAIKVTVLTSCAIMPALAKLIQTFQRPKFPHHQVAILLAGYAQSCKTRGFTTGREQWPRGPIHGESQGPFNEGKKI